MKLPLPALAYGLTAILICGVYPLALVGQLAVEAALGDGLLMREWRYGSQRVVALEVIRAWVASLLWVPIVWVGLALLRRALGAPRAATAALAAAAAVLGAALAGVVPIPAIFGWLLLACIVLEAAGHAFAARRMVAWV